MTTNSRSRLPSGTRRATEHVLLPDVPSLRSKAMLRRLEGVQQRLTYSNHGPLSRELERALAERVGADPRQVATFSSGTTALECALQALRLPEKANVLVPAFTFPATVTAVQRAGLTPMLCDVDPVTWALTPELADDWVRQRWGVYKAVVPVCALGAWQSTREWRKFSERHHVPVVLDAAAAFGNVKLDASRLKDSQLSVVLSLHATKSLPSVEGGVLVGGNPFAVRDAQRLSNFGFNDERLVVSGGGTNAKLSELHAAVGLEALAQYERVAKLRQQVALWYYTETQRYLSTVGFQRRSLDDVLTTFCVLLPRSVDRARVEDLLRKKGVATRRWYSPALDEHPAFTHLRGSRAEDPFPVTRDLANRVLGLPFHTRLKRADVVYVCQQLAAALRESEL